MDGEPYLSVGRWERKDERTLPERGGGPSKLPIISVPGSFVMTLVSL